MSVPIIEIADDSLSCISSTPSVMICDEEEFLQKSRENERILKISLVLRLPFKKKKKLNFGPFLKNCLKNSIEIEPSPKLNTNSSEIESFFKKKMELEPIVIINNEEIKNDLILIDSTEDEARSEYSNILRERLELGKGSSVTKKISKIVRKRDFPNKKNRRLEMDDSQCCPDVIEEIFDCSKSFINVEDFSKESESGRNVLVEENLNVWRNKSIKSIQVLSNVDSKIVVRCDSNKIRKLNSNDNVIVLDLESNTFTKSGHGLSEVEPCVVFNSEVDSLKNLDSNENKIILEECLKNLNSNEDKIILDSESNYIANSNFYADKKLLSLDAESNNIPNSTSIDSKIIFDSESKTIINSNATNKTILSSEERNTVDPTSIDNLILSSSLTNIANSISNEKINFDSCLTTIANSNLYAKIDLNLESNTMTNSCSIESKLVEPNITAITNSSSTAKIDLNSESNTLPNPSSIETKLIEPNIIANSDDGKIKVGKEYQAVIPSLKLNFFKNICRPFEHYANSVSNSRTKERNSDQQTEGLQLFGKASSNKKTKDLNFDSKMDEEQILTPHTSNKKNKDLTKKILDYYPALISTKKVKDLTPDQTKDKKMDIEQSLISNKDLTADQKNDEVSQPVEACVETKEERKFPKKLWDPNSISEEDFINCKSTLQMGLGLSYFPDEVACNLLMENEYSIERTINYCFENLESLQKKIIEGFIPVDPLFRKTRNSKYNKFLVRMG